MGLESMLLIYDVAVIGAVDGRQSSKNTVSQPYLFSVDSINNPMFIYVLE